jgi:flagellum-specific ATP synthase
MKDMSEQLAEIIPTAMTGRLVRTVGMAAAVTGFRAPLGAMVEIERAGGSPVAAEVIGFRDELNLLAPLGDLQGTHHGSLVRLRRTRNSLRVGRELLGRVIDAQGTVIDGRRAPGLSERVALEGNAPSAMTRPRITKQFSTGVRAIDGLLTCGQGQRMGILAGAGVGKSVLLGMLARNSTADVNVIALIGERGREVNEFLERDLQASGLAKSVVVVATSDEPAPLRTRAAHTATAIAEYFRDQGAQVLLLVDSLTRFAYAQREIGLAAGEPPAMRGYPPSVFGALPKLVERAGLNPRGGITAFYSVLVEGDDPNEPVSDSVRSLLDGHLWLSRKLANRGHFPAIDVLASISRVMSDVTTPSEREAASTMRELLAAYRDHEDLISIGAYRRGSNRVVDTAIEMQEPLQQFLRQQVAEHSTAEQSREQLFSLLRLARERMQTSPAKTVR